MIPDPVLVLMCPKHGALIVELDAESVARAAASGEEHLEVRRCRKCLKITGNAIHAIMSANPRDPSILNSPGYINVQTLRVPWSGLRPAIQRAMRRGKTEKVHIPDPGHNPMVVPEL